MAESLPWLMDHPVVRRMGAPSTRGTVVSADALRAALVELDVAVVANHVTDTPLGSIDWVGVAAELGREPTAAEITRAWLAMGRADGWTSTTETRQREDPLS